MLPVSRQQRRAETRRAKKKRIEILCDHCNSNEHLTHNCPIVEWFNSTFPPIDRKVSNREEITRAISMSNFCENLTLHTSDGSYDGALFAKLSVSDLINNGNFTSLSFKTQEIPLVLIGELLAREIMMKVRMDDLSYAYMHEKIIYAHSVTVDEKTLVIPSEGNIPLLCELYDQHNPGANSKEEIETGIHRVIFNYV